MSEIEKCAVEGFEELTKLNYDWAATSHDFKIEVPAVCDTLINGSAVIKVSHKIKTCATTGEMKDIWEMGYTIVAQGSDGKKKRKHSNGLIMEGGIESLERCHALMLKDMEKAVESFPKKREED